MSVRRHPRLPWRRAIVAAGGLVLLATRARADAPTGPGAQYDLFDDTAPVIHDLWTHLYWERRPQVNGVTLAGAVQYCKTLSIGTGSLSSGWRLPSYKELLTLVDETPHVEYDDATLSLETKWIDAYAFSGADVNSFYWTSSLYPLDTSNSTFYYVDFARATGGHSPANQAANVRCVHFP